VRDAVALDHGGGAQPNGCRGEVVEPADAFAEQDGHEVDGDGVQQARVQALLGDLRAGDDDVLVPATALAGRTASSTLSTKVNVSVCGQSTDGSWVTTTTGTPSGCVPPQPWVMSNRCRR
jgi:hypothetical protein